MQRISLAILLAVVHAPASAEIAADPITPQSPEIKGVLQDIRDLIKDREANDLASMPLHVSGSLWSARGAPEIDAAKIPKGFELLPLQFPAKSGACSWLRPGHRVTCLETQSRTGRCSIRIPDATVVSLSVPYAYHRVDNLAATVVVHQPDGTTLDDGQVTTTMTSETSGLMRTVTLLVSRASAEKFWGNYDIESAQQSRWHLVRYIAVHDALD